MKLYQCHTQAEQVAWLRGVLMAEHTVSDAEMWVGGVDNPDELVRILRQEGMQIKTTRKRIQDAAGEWHNDLAWRKA